MAKSKTAKATRMSGTVVTVAGNPVTHAIIERKGDGIRFFCEPTEFPQSYLRVKDKVTFEEGTKFDPAHTVPALQDKNHAINITLIVKQEQFDMRLSWAPMMANDTAVMVVTIERGEQRGQSEIVIHQGPKELDRGIITGSDSVQIPLPVGNADSMFFKITSDNPKTTRHIPWHRPKADTIKARPVRQDGEWTIYRVSTYKTGNRPQPLPTRFVVTSTNGAIEGSYLSNLTATTTGYQLTFATEQDTGEALIRLRPVAGKKLPLEFSVVGLLDATDGPITLAGKPEDPPEEEADHMVLHPGARGDGFQDFEMFSIGDKGNQVAGKGVLTCAYEIEVIVIATGAPWGTGKGTRVVGDIGANGFEAVRTKLVDADDKVLEGKVVGGIEGKVRKTEPFTISRKPKTVTPPVAKLKLSHNDAHTLCVAMYDKDDQEATGTIDVEAISDGADKTEFTDVSGKNAQFRKTGSNLASDNHGFEFDVQYPERDITIRAWPSGKRGLAQTITLMQT